MGKVVTAVLLILMFAIAGCVRKKAQSPPSGNCANEQNCCANLSENMKELRLHFKQLSEVTEHDAAEIEVQHILIGISGAGLPGVTRSIAEAETLTADIYARVKSGDNFCQLVRERSEDSYPGRYTMINRLVGTRPEGKWGRADMVPSFGNVGWRLEVGEVGVSNYDSDDSPYGFHIIKRLK